MVIVDARTGPRIVIGDRDTVGINTAAAAARTLRRTARTTVRVTPTRHIRSRMGEADTRPTRIPTPRSSPMDRMAVIVGVEVEVGDTTRTIAEGEAEEVTITLMAAPMAETRTANLMAMVDTTAAPTVAMVATVETAVVEAMVAGVVAVATKEEEAAAAVDHMAAAAAMADSSRMVDAAASTKARTETPTTTIRVGVITDRVADEEDVGDCLAASFFFVEYFFV